MSNEEQEVWVTLSEAAQAVGTSISKLSRLVRDGKLSTQRDPYDNRKVLVNMDEVNGIFKPRYRR